MRRRQDVSKPVSFAVGQLQPRPLSDQGTKRAYLKITAWLNAHSLGFMRLAFSLRKHETQLCAFFVPEPSLAASERIVSASQKETRCIEGVH
jgi:hypothetical protein